MTKLIDMDIGISEAIALTQKGITNERIDVLLSSIELLKRLIGRNKGIEEAIIAAQVGFKYVNFQR